MQLLRSPLFILSCLLFIVHQLFQKVLQIAIPIADAYLDNLLVMPILLNLWLAEKQWLFNEKNNHRITKLEIAIATLYVLVVTEWLFPLLSHRFVFDELDILLTMSGSFIYFFVEKQPALRTQH